MISTFKHKGLERFHRQALVQGIQPAHAKRLRGILALLETAKIISDMDVPKLKLHPLKGDLQGFWAVWVDENWRVIFKFENGTAYDVSLIDYH